MHFLQIFVLYISIILCGSWKPFMGAQANPPTGLGEADSFVPEMSTIGKPDNY